MTPLAPARWSVIARLATGIAIGCAGMALLGMYIGRGRGWRSIVGGMAG